jgi:hypothetical protein
MGYDEPTETMSDEEKRAVVIALVPEVPEILHETLTALRKPSIWRVDVPS